MSKATTVSRIPKKGVFFYARLQSAVSIVEESAKRMARRGPHSTCSFLDPV